MRFVRRSAVVLVAVAGAALAQQPPGPRPNQPPPTSQLPAEIVPDSSKPQATPGPSADWLAEWDTLWRQRNDVAAIQRLEQLAEEHDCVISWPF